MNLVNDSIEKYIEEHATTEDIVLRELARETFLKVQMPQMLSGHVQGLFLENFCCALNPHRILEIGTFTGYSAICLARGLNSNGLLYTIDINEELSEICNKYFTKAGLENKIKQLVGNANSLIPELKETFDLVFIDADKTNYTNYYNLVFEKVRVGGFIITDNVLWSGKITQEKKDKDTTAIDNYNQLVANDKRVKSIILPVRDGLNICRKISQ